MKKYIIKPLAFLCGAAIMASCSENSWNDHLDGFEGGFTYDEKISVEYTLTNTDYETIGKALLAVSKNKADSTAARAISSNHYFDKTSPFPAAIAIPYLLDNTSSDYYIYSNGSTVDVSFREASAVPEEISQISDALTYTVTGADYQEIWGSDDNYINGFAPMLPAQNYLPSILSKAYPDATEGQYAVISYSETQENPIFGDQELVQYPIVIYAEDTFSDEGGFVAALPISTESAYSYLNVEHISVVDGIPQGYSSDAVWTLTETMGGYFLSDANGTYLYGSDRYNNFYWASEPVTGDATYTFNVNEEEDENVLYCEGAGKWMQYTSYGNFGEYNYQSGNSAHVYMIDTNKASLPTRSVINTPVTTNLNALYYFNGSNWVTAEKATILNPADYTSMGFSNNNLSDPEIYIPLYLKIEYPYAQAGDEIYVAYNIKTNSCSTDLFVFDGSAWTMNNNGLEDVMAAFVKNEGKWNFLKYLGKAIYNIFEESEIITDRTYLLVSGNVCATPVAASNSYGYLLTTPVNISNGQIVMANENNGFIFAKTYVYNGEVRTVPEGMFLIQDSNGRYLYLQGTYSSFNLRADSPYVNEDGSVGEGYLFTATIQPDGTWAITNNRGEGNIRNIYYSTGYSNFAAYTSQGDNDSLPYLYLLEEE